MTRGALILLLLAALAVAGDDPAGETTVRWALDRTMDERIAADPLNGPLHGDLLLLPHPHVGPMLGAPRILENGDFPVLAADRARLCFRLVPLLDAHREYLRQREALLAEEKREELVEWCLDQGLPWCAEYETRVWLDEYASVADEGYRKALPFWVKLNREKQLDTSFPLPVKGEWFVARDATGHHRQKDGAYFAWDLIRREGRDGYRGRGTDLADHYAWDQPVVAQADGVVHQVVDGNPDAPVGQSGGFANANLVVVYYGGGICGLYAHLKNGSVVVKRGDRVEAGQELGRTGNSGHSVRPHLHFTMMDVSYSSVRGRFRYQVRSGKTWRTVTDEDLRADRTVRNLPHVFSEEDGR